MAHARGRSHGGQSRRQNANDDLNNRLPCLLLHSNCQLSIINYPFKRGCARRRIPSCSLCVAALTVTVAATATVVTASAATAGAATSVAAGIATSVTSRVAASGVGRCSSLAQVAQELRDGCQLVVELLLRLANILTTFFAFFSNIFLYIPSASSEGIGDLVRYISESLSEGIGRGVWYFRRCGFMSI